MTNGRIGLFGGLCVCGLVLGLARGQEPLLPRPRALVPQDRAAPAAPADTADEPPLDLVEFRDVPLEEAMRLLSRQSGLKIVPSQEAAKQKVSLYLENVTPLVVITAVTQANGLIYRRDPATGIVRVYTPRENQRDLSSFRQEQTEVFTLLYPNALNVATAIRSVFASRAQVSYGTQVDALTYNELQNRLTRFDLINSRSLGIGFPNANGTGSGTSGGGGIGGFGSGVGGVGGVGIGGAGGLGTGIGGAGGFGVGIGGAGGLGTNFLTNQPQFQQNLRQQAEERPDQRLRDLTPDEIQALENSFTSGEAPDRRVLLELLRQRPATIYVSVVQQSNQVVVRTSDPDAMQQIRELVCRLDVPTPEVLLEVKVLSINLTDEFNSVFDFQFTDGKTIAGGFSPAANAAIGGPLSSITTGNILPPFADALSSDARRFATIAPGPLNTPPNQNFTFQIVTPNFRARLQALEAKNRVTNLGTPLLMTANNEVSRIFSGQTQPITVGFSSNSSVVSPVATTTPTVTTGATVVTSGSIPVPTTVLQDIGTTLLITPSINADRTVTLRIFEENSSVVVNGGSIPVANAVGNVTQVPVDIVQRQNLGGTVVVTDGDTAAIGGLIQERVSDTRSEVPIFGKIPVVGFLFRGQDTYRQRTEVVILVRPYVITMPCEAAKPSKMLLEALSIHPNVPVGGLGTLGTYLPAEVLRPDPPRTELQKIFRLQTIIPKEF